MYTGTKKQLLSTPEFRQHYFEPLQNLDETFQVQVLQEVAKKELSLGDMKQAANDFRTMKLAKALFAR